MQASVNNTHPVSRINEQEGSEDMFVMYNADTMKVPVRVWLKEEKDLEKGCMEQAYHLSRLPFLHKWVSLMPDTHTGMGMPIGGVIAAKGVVIPNAVGVDIGCGMAYTETNIRVEDIKNVMTGNGSLIQAIVGDIMRNIPVGFAHHKTEMPCYTLDVAFEEMDRYEEDAELLGQLEAGYFQIGTLGGGNHFIELDKGTDGSMYLVIHTGSRHLGEEVAEYYTKLANSRLKEQGKGIPYYMSYLEGTDRADYMEDVQIIQKYAEWNRQIIVREIVKGMKWKAVEQFSAEHNYLDTSGILHKGTVSARNGEKVIIPANMKEGAILGIGKGNEEWNYSAPHGSGRKREDVKNQHTVSEFKKEMKGIYSSCIGTETLDEAPFAYRSIKEIAEQIKDSVEVTEILKPVYNFKAGNPK